jgi:lipopolysaccharide transport system ATP-binding protein
VVKQFAAERYPEPFYHAIRHLLASRRRRFTALDIHHLEIWPGERVVVVGNNGAGKTTLLKVLAGLIRPTQGSVTVNGTVTLLSGLGVGMVNELSAVDNLQLYAAIYGVDRSTMRERTDDMLEWAELKEFAGTKLRQLSAGMRARLAFSLLRHIDRDVYLLDEVMTAGDQSFREKCDDVFCEHIRANKTLVATTHDRRFAETFFDKALWLEGGRIRAFGMAPVVLDAYFGGALTQAAR